MHIEEPPKNQTMPEVSESSSAEDAAAITTPQSIDLSNVEDQLEPKTETIAGTSEEKGGATNESATADPEYPKAWKMLVIVAGLCLAVFLVALDQTIVAVAVPKITDHFHSLDDVGWCVCHKSADLDQALTSAGMALHTSSPEPHYSLVLDESMLNLMCVNRVTRCSIELTSCRSKQSSSSL